ncbi:hypothetical protein ACFL2Q_00285 [Thermodesulfobacteriota bacterium]
MDDEALKDQIMKKQSDGRITCPVALQLAKEAGISGGKIGRLLDEMKIKIHSCQLGCFD